MILKLLLGQARFRIASLACIIVVTTSVISLCRVAWLQNLDRNRGESEGSTFAKMSKAEADEYRQAVADT